MNFKIQKEMGFLALPLILQSLLSISYSIIYEKILGHTDLEVYVAVNGITNFFFFILGFLGYLSVNLQIKGSQKKENISNLFITNTIINMLLAVIVIIFTFFIGNFFLSFYFNFSDETLKIANIFLKYVALNFFLALMIFTYNGVIKSLKRTKEILIASTISTISCFIFLTIISFYFSLNIHVFGILQILSSIITLLCFIIRIPIHFVKPSLASQFKMVFQTLRESLPLMLQELMDSTLFYLIINSIIAHYSTEIYAGYLLLSNIYNYMMLPIFMYCSSLLTLIGERIREKKGVIYTFIHECMKINYFIFLSSIVLFFFFLDTILLFFTNQPEIFQGAKLIIYIFPMIYIFQPAFEIYKYSIQAYSMGEKILIPTFITNSVSVIIIYFLATLFNLNIFYVFLIISFNYFTLMLICYTTLKKIIR